jgi:hypothetical protein
MDIYLEAFTSRGTFILEIGAYHSPVVPRIGEKIALQLASRPGETPYQSSLLFRVTNVRYTVNNTMQTEDWQSPYPFGDVSVSVSVRVEPVTTPEGKAAQDYIDRLAAKE